MKNSLAALLTITLSGAFYLFCCQAAAANSAHHAVRTENSAQHCHFSKGKPSETLPAAARIEAFEYCPLKFSFLAAKLEKNHFPHAAPARAYSFFRFPESIKLAPRAGFTDFSYRAPVFDSRASYIRNCVFRI